MAPQTSTQAPPASSPTPADGRVALSLDVTDLEASCRFYARLGFKVAHVDRPGLIFETRTLHSPALPQLAIRLRQAFGKRVGGSQPGGMLSLSLPQPNLASWIEANREGLRWLGPAPPPGATAVKCSDPDGYIFELVAVEA